MPAKTNLSVSTEGKETGATWLRSARMPSQKPPLQLVPGDKFNLTLGVLGCIGLASCKDAKSLHPFVRWSCNAYTNWNLAFILLGTLTGQKQWEPFLLVNSVGIFLGFRTAFCQGLDENMRKKVRDLGLDLTRARFLFADHMCHTAPVIALLYALVKRKQRIHPMNSIYAIILSTWFSFRQSAQLDASDLYVHILGSERGVPSSPALPSHRRSSTPSYAASTGRLLCAYWVLPCRGCWRSSTQSFGRSTILSASSRKPRRWRRLGLRRNASWCGIVMGTPPCRERNLSS